MIKPPINKQSLAFVDLETTGATASRDRITEIGIILVDGDKVEEWSTLVQPEARIPSHIERLTGITNEMVADAPCFADVAQTVMRLLEGRVFVAHNARFDYAFLKQSFMREGIDFSAKTLCTVKLSRRLFPNYPRHNLDSLIARHNLQVDARHRAIGDARLIHQFWRHIHQTLDHETIDHAVKTLLGRPSIPTHLDLTLIDGLPERPGVYLFYGENGLPLYIGKSKNIRQRVMSHFAADVSSAKEMSLSQQVRRIEFHSTGGEIGALLKEAQLVKQLQPTHNRLLRRNNELCSIQLQESASGHQVRIAYASHLDFSTEANLFGLFQSQREATKTLSQIAEDHRLCKGLLGLEKIKAGSPCFGWQLRRCDGACVGKETRQSHDLRLMTALAGLRIKTWPFSGPAYLREGDEMLLIHQWAYLGSARTEEEVWSALDGHQARFDKDTYRILVKVIHKLKPLPTPGQAVQANPLSDTV